MQTSTPSVTLNFAFYNLTEHFQKKKNLSKMHNNNL